MYKNILIILMILSSSLFANADLEKVKLQLKWFSSFQFAGYYMAKEKGFYKEAGLDVEIIERDANKNNIEQVISGEADYGIADSAILLYRAKGKPVKIIASIFQHSPLVFISKKESGIYSPFEMKSKVLSFQKGVDDAPLLAMLKGAHIAESDYTFEALDFSNEAFIRGEVDVMSAHLSNQPFFMKQRGVEINIINPLNYGIDFYGDNLFTTEKEIANNPKRVELFRQASIKGWHYALENIDETIDTLISKYNTKRTKAHLKEEALIIQDMIIPDMVELGYTSSDRFYRIGQIYQRIGKIDKYQLDNALDELIYNPKEGNIWVKYFYIALALLTLFATLSIIFFIISKNLQKLVKNKTSALNEKEKMINMYVLISESDLDGIITYASEAFCDISGYSKDKLLGQSYAMVRHPDMPSSTYKELWGKIQNGKTWRGELKNRNKEGNSYWLDAYISPIIDAQNHTIGYRSIKQDITDRKAVEALSIRDGLTNIYNRRHFNTILPQMINSSKRRNDLVCFAILDIDYFKQYNDIYGHQAGDNALIKVAESIDNSIHRSDDYCFRLGGEEFGVLFKLENIENAKLLAESIRKKIEDLHIQHSGSSASPYLTLSVGLISLYANNIKDDKEFYKQADNLLYEAKKSGRNRVCSA